MASTWEDLEARLNQTLSGSEGKDEALLTMPLPTLTLSPSATRSVSLTPTPTRTTRTPTLPTTATITPSPDLDTNAIFGSLLNGSGNGTDVANLFHGSENSDISDMFNKALDSINIASGKYAQSSSGLSTGAVVGIVLGCVGLVALIAALVIRNKQLQAQEPQQSPSRYAHESGQMSFVGARSPTAYKGQHRSNIDARRSYIGSGITTNMMIDTYNSSSTTSDPRTGSSATASRDDHTAINAKSGASILALALAGKSESPVLWEDEVIVTARIPREKVLAMTLISRGGYGEVYLGVYNNHQVAIKTLLSETRKNLKQINAFLSEVKLMANLEHERIVRFVGVAWDSLTDLCVVCEFMEGGDLRGLLVKFEEGDECQGRRRPHGFDNDKIKIALHVAHALTYLHSLQPQVLHRDLKSKNILLDKHLNAKITDFGVSRERSDSTMTANVGTSLWMAPEVMIGERYDQKADVFSFGIVLSELDSHSLPYSQNRETSDGHRIPDAAVLQMVAMGRMKVEFSNSNNDNTVQDEMVDLGNACVSVNPKERPTASEALYKLHVMLRSHSGTVSGFV